ncbi:pentapeptide repeat-containing protein [Streptomyces andamanensis]|uniref:Pentapeptide repeat-containing protein n=1 Tax=Streptomyces andamanensis TaxID=1565035 RepID=A0ABV8TLX7_9ACTN
MEPGRTDKWVPPRFPDDRFAARRLREWLDEDAGLDAIGLDLSGADLSRGDFSESMFIDAKLIGTRLVGDGHDGSTVDHHDPHGGAHGHESDLGGGGDTHLPRDIDLDGPMANVPDGPSGSLPDGSWAGENGLHLDPEANRVADEFMDRSKKAEPDITESMQSVASRVDEGKLIGLEYRLKGADSLKRKLATDLFENIGRRPGEVLGGIKDSIRYTMEVPVERYTHGVQQAIDELQAKGFENVTYKNTWDSAGYKGINSTWRDPVSGQAFEVQFHTADSFTAKMDGHVLYEKERLPGVSPEELAAIKVEQTELFGRVPVPHGAADIRLGAHGSADVVPAISRESGGSAGHAVPPTHEPHGPPHGHQASDLHDPEHSVEPTGHGQGTSHGHQESPGESPYTEGPRGGWSGAGWVEKPDPIHDPDSVVAAEMYEHIRSTENRVELPAISKNTGVDESVLRQVKSHLFRSQHEVAIGPGTTKKGLFTPRRDIGELWFAAREGKLSEEGVQQFKHLMAHEYVESSLMKSGLPYIREYDHLWELDPSDGKYYRPQFPQDVRDAGAHDLAPNDKIGGFRHWRSLGMEHPGVVLADDLSNLDDVVKAIHQQLRSKGLEL